MLLAGDDHLPNLSSKLLKKALVPVVDHILGHLQAGTGRMGTAIRPSMLEMKLAQTKAESGPTAS